MGLKKKLDYGFNGYKVPVVPRAPRSIRRRGLQKKPIEDGQFFAFELLATVAGKLLQESISSASSNGAEGKVQYCFDNVVVRNEQVEDKPLISECHDQGSCMDSVFVPVPAAEACNVKCSSKEYQHTNNDSLVEHPSVVLNSCFSNEVGCDVNLENCKSKKAVENFPNKAEKGYSDVGESYYGTDNVTGRQLETVDEQNGDLTVGNICSSKDPIELCTNTLVPVISETSVQLPLSRDHTANASFSMHRNGAKVGNRDDDENSYGCSKLSTKIRPFRRQSRVGYRKLRKLFSKYWKVAPKLKDYELSHTDGGVKAFYRNREAIYTKERCQHGSSKRRKMFNHVSEVACDQEASSESISNSPDKGMTGDKNFRATIYHRANGVSSFVDCHQVSRQSKDSHVKLRIKSFRVPAINIEVPETTTLGSLRKTVLEAVTSILGGGLRVGILLQGKRVSDDNRTLLQTGISNGGRFDDLGFTLEPNFARVSLPKNTALVLPCDTHEQSFRSPIHPILEQRSSEVLFDSSPVTNLDQPTESNCDLVSSQDNVKMDGSVSYTKTLVSTSTMNTKTPAIVPMNQKAKRSEFSRRRTRRPFSVSEVEALVKAVEKLGTGRWRDVKMCSFDNEDHRTYVDLKDKWKTLVHTASIFPQQRRGEPVPQELLNRVLAAHSYWSQQQVKQHCKNQAEHLGNLGEEMKGDRG